MLLSHLFEDPDIMAVVRLGDVTVEVHRHLADQQHKRRVSNRRVEDVLRQIHMVPRRQIMALPHGQRFWVYDPKNDTALGYTMISPERRVLRLKTTVPNRPWDSDRPIFDLPGARKLQENRTAQVELDNGEQRQVRWIPGRRDMLEMIIAYYARQGRRVQRVDDVDIDWQDEVPITEVSGLGELDVSERLQKYFTDRGYRIAGEGRDQMVFHRPGQRHVIKVIGQSASGIERGEAIADYVRFFAMNQGNPHFPRVSQPREIDVEEEIYTIYRQELLQDLSDDEEERLLDWIQAFGQALGDPMGPGMVKAWLQNNPPPRSLPQRQVQGVYAAVTKLLQHYGDDLGLEMRLDLDHAANFMQRADGTIVVVDPIAYDEEYGTYSESTYMKIDEITLGSEEELFAGGGFLPRIDVDAEDADVRPLDRRYALWPQRHIQEIAREDDAIGEQFPDWETAGIIDTQTGRAVAVIAWQEAYRSPFPGAVEIHQVEVDPRLRGQGFARYLYELVRRKHTLLADEDQTPNGARMWVGMQQAGLPVQGYISFGSGRTPEELDAEGETRFSYVEELKKMNARLINPGNRFPVYVFPVQAQGGRLDTPANTPLKVYRSGYTNQWTPGLVVMKGG